MGYKAPPIDPPDEELDSREDESGEDYMLRTGRDYYGNKLSSRDYYYLTYGDVD